MQDRVSQHPGRVKLKPVSGQENVYDMEWADGATVAGTPLNKANLLADTTASLFGLTSTATPNQVLAKIPHSVNTGWKLLQSYTTAGSFSWTAPAQFGAGVKYKIGVLVIGGGGAGAAYIAEDRGVANGGASGYSVSFIMEVTPGESYSVVIGAGGVSATADSSDDYVHGGNGGSSSFNGITADGGEGGFPSTGNYAKGSIGAQCSMIVLPALLSEDESALLFGGTVVPIRYSSQYYDPITSLGTPSACFNPFESKRILAAGGYACEFNTRSAAINGGKDPVDGKGGGNGGYSTTSAYATDADSPGCGGGGALSTYTGSSRRAVSGAGADGAVYIYVQGDF